MKPNNKVWAAGIAGALTTIAVSLWNSFLPNHQLTPEVQGAVQTVITFAVAYAIPNSPAA